MTDYYSLLSRVIAGLRDNTAEARRVIYDAARMHVVDEMGKTQPPLPESALTRERLALEQAIRDVEQEQLARSLRTRGA